jgi:hypothetical protein
MVVGVLIGKFLPIIPTLEAFLPYIDNWATCDLMSPKVFKKHTALVKQPDAVIPFIEEQRLEKWTHNKAIQKAGSTTKPKHICGS